jgi:hypothetical protein
MSRLSGSRRTISRASRATARPAGAMAVEKMKLRAEFMR